MAKKLLLKLPPPLAKDPDDWKAILCVAEYKDLKQAVRSRTFYPRFNLLVYINEGPFGHEIGSRPRVMLS
jgi:hypothetical protein